MGMYSGISPVRKRASRLLQLSVFQFFAVLGLGWGELGGGLFLLLDLVVQGAEAVG